jgi:hypothetical protein
MFGISCNLYTSLCVSGMELFVETHAKHVIVNLSEVSVRDCFRFHRKMLNIQACRYKIWKPREKCNIVVE